MNRSYGFRNHQIAALFQGLMESREILFEDATFMKDMFAVPEFLRFDIAGYLVAEFAKRAGCLTTVTFDRAAARHIPGMELLA
jgi:predicted nucleic-acid-binding protein